MFLSVTSTAPPAGDLGFLLHKHPDRVQQFPLSVGTAHVFYPEVTDERCTAVLLLDVDPVGLVRQRRLGSDGFELAQYVNDRPYAASSMLAVAIGKVFSSALRGRCEARPALATAPLPLEIRLSALPVRGGPDLLTRLFEPLGWSVHATGEPLDPQMPAWGPSPFAEVVLTGHQRLADALEHLYVLLPVLDGAKHYWVGPDEVDKLLRRGSGWLAAHPELEFITRRYLAHRRRYVFDALARFAELDGTPPASDEEGEPMADSADTDGAGSATAEPDVDDPAVTEPAVDDARVATRSLADARIDAVMGALRDAGAQRVLDLGCGEGSLLRPLLADASFTEIVGVDVSPRALEKAARRLHVDRMGDRERARLQLLHSALTYRDDRLAGYDAAVLMEVVEHLDPDRLPTVVRNVFGHAQPRVVVVTTPNQEHNVRYPLVGPTGLRHRDHRFEWTRAEFADWTEQTAAAHGYRVVRSDVGVLDPEVGAPTQMAVFIRDAAEGES